MFSLVSAYTISVTSLFRTHIFEMTFDFMDWCLLIESCDENPDFVPDFDKF